MTKDELNLAKVGLMALIDEATGYQDVRPPADLQKEYQRLTKDEVPEKEF